MGFVCFPDCIVSPITLHVLTDVLLHLNRRVQKVRNIQERETNVSERLVGAVKRGANCEGLALKL